MAEERIQVKGKGERERYTHVNVEFLRTARSKEVVNNAR